MADRHHGGLFAGIELDDPTRPVVIAVTVEQGGFGAETAAPIARLIASKWFNQPEKFVAGSSKTY